MRLVINSQFFLDPEAWEQLGNEILPEIVKTNGELHAWSAGCYTGKEPFSLAMLLAESQPQCRPRILATDRDRSALTAAANGGPFSARDIERIPAEWRARYLTMRDDRYFVESFLHERIEFKVHDLLLDRYPFHFDVILYRNLEPCFSKDENLAIWNKFRNALNPGGVLFTGATDRMPAELNPAMERIRPCLFRRLE
jgi:chemotaxis protein methyltransferase CheR